MKSYSRQTWLLLFFGSSKNESPLCYSRIRFWIMQPKAAGQSFNLEKGNRLTLEKGNQLTLGKGNQLTLERGHQSLQANPWERDRASSFSSLLPGPRTVATLEPPEGYWESFHQEWLERVGGCYFAVGRQSLQFVKNEDNWVYCCLLVGPELSLFPVIRPHMSLCRCRFDTFQAFWAAKICCREVISHSMAKASISNFAMGVSWQPLAAC